MPHRVVHEARVKHPLALVLHRPPVRHRENAARAARGAAGGVQLRLRLRLRIRGRRRLHLRRQAGALLARLPQKAAADGAGSRHAVRGERPPALPRVAGTRLDVDVGNLRRRAHGVRVIRRPRRPCHRRPPVYLLPLGLPLQQGGAPRGVQRLQRSRPRGPAHTRQNPALLRGNVLARVPGDAVRAAAPWSEAAVTRGRRPATATFRHRDPGSGSPHTAPPSPPQRGAPRSIHSPPAGRGQRCAARTSAPAPLACAAQPAPPRPASAAARAPRQHCGR